jgi:uncharacterized protein YndB with AHSA1/START domain
MPRVAASRELLAPPEDVWAFLAEPNHLADWWPGVAAVRPDRRGLAPAARWQLVTGPQSLNVASAYLRRREVAGTVVILEVKPMQLVRLMFANDGIEATLQLEPTGHDHTRATLEIDGPWLRVNRSLPRTALNRLHSLCQTAAEE